MQDLSEALREYGVRVSQPPDLYAAVEAEDDDPTAPEEVEEDEELAAGLGTATLRLSDEAAAAMKAMHAGGVAMAASSSKGRRQRKNKLTHRQLG